MNQGDSERLHLNERAFKLLEDLCVGAPQLDISCSRSETLGLLVDAGVENPGSIEAGLQLARLCLAGLGEVELTITGLPAKNGKLVSVTTDQPVAACMASQYAGWQISVGKFFAMGSGPMRAAYGREELYDTIGLREEGVRDVVGILETSELPAEEVYEFVAEKTGVSRQSVHLACASTKSAAGTVQVVARSVETALHKLYELGFDLHRVLAGRGSAPLPPDAADDFKALGRANDAILYGGQVVLTVRGDDGSIEELGARVPSCSSSDHGAPFAEIFERYGRDFYQIDPHLFSPAEITFENADTGRSFRFGRVEPELLERSFYES